MLVTLVGAYFGSWPWFKERARNDVRDYATSSELVWSARPESPIVPYIIHIDVNQFSPGGTGTTNCRYYLWLFGPVLKLPYEREIPYQRTLRGVVLEDSSFPAALH